MDFVLLWLIASIIFLTVELFSPGLFFFVSFFFGALGAALAAFKNASGTQQTVIFFASSVLTFILLRYWIKRKTAHSHYQSNASALIGKRGVVLADITPVGVGTVKVQGEVWSAKLMYDEPIAKGAVVEVVNVVGCHVVVKQYFAKEQQ